MQLNNLKPATGSRYAKRRVGRGVGSGLGKMAGRGHKSQKSRSGGFHKVGFGGGQIPLHRCPPKHGFTSLAKEFTAEVHLGDLVGLPIGEIDLLPFKQVGFVGGMVESAKVTLLGETDKKVTLKGISATAEAKAAIETAGGSLV